MHRLTGWILLMALATAACGSGSDSSAGIASLDGSTSAPAAAETTEAVEPEEAMLALTECLRDQGLEVSDPEIGDDGNLRLGALFRDAREAGDLDRESVRSALEACDEYAAAVRTQFDEVDRSEIEDQMYEYAACMRENGYDMADPEFGEPGGEGQGPGFGGGPFAGMDPSDPDFQAANEVCGDLFAGGLRPPGSGLGGGPGGTEGEPPDGPPPGDPSDGGA